MVCLSGCFLSANRIFCSVHCHPLLFFNASLLQYTYESPLSTVGTNADMRGWPSILIALVVLGGMVGLAFVAGKMKKNRDPQGLRTSHTEFSNL